ncbi:MAG: hypothetical protein R3F23_02645 [Verrucomicrobiia bacterium]
MNGDGVDDIILGNTLASPNGASSGESYIIYGHDYSPQGDFTANSAPDLFLKKGRNYSVLPLAIDDTKRVIAELPDNGTFALPASIFANQKRPKVLVTLDFDDGGVTDVLIKNGKSQLKLFRLENDGKPVTPTLLDEIDFTLAKKHRFLAAGPFTGKRDDKLDLLIKNKKNLLVAENVGKSFKTNLVAVSGKLAKGKILSIQKDGIYLLKGKKISRQAIDNLALGATTELGKLASGQKAKLILDINQDGKLDVVAQGKKRAIGYVSIDSLATTPTPILTLPKKNKLIGPK